MNLHMEKSGFSFRLCYIDRNLKPRCVDVSACNCHRGAALRGTGSIHSRTMIDGLDNDVRLNTGENTMPEMLASQAVKMLHLAGVQV